MNEPSEIVFEVRIIEPEQEAGSTSLSDILNLFEGDSLNWSLLSLWATGNLGEGRSIPDLESLVRESPRGLILPFGELKNLATCFDQVIDTLIIGCSSLSKVARYNNNEEMFVACDVVIEMDDSTRWIIHSHDNGLVDKISSSFRNSMVIA